MDEYEKLLNKAKKGQPEVAVNVERFEVPKVTGHVQGNRTIISNFYQIASTLRREPEHLLKFVLKELAAPGELTNSALIIGTKVPSAKINEKIEQYVQLFVICPICKRPDTNLIKEDKNIYLRCMACGTKTVIKSNII